MTQDTPGFPQATVKAAVVQAAPIGFRPKETLEKAKHLAHEAADEGAELIVFPEAFLSAYPRGMDFDTVVGSRTDRARDLYLEYWNSAIDIPGPITDELAELAHTTQAHIVMGVIERDGGTLYCSSLYLSPETGLESRHRKMMPTGTERLIWGFGDGSDLDVMETAVGNLGMAICWENYMPLLRMTLYKQNVQVWVAPTADARDSWVATMRHIAVEGRCFVLGANQYATRSDYPDTYKSIFGDDPDTIITRGSSCIVDPFGGLLAGPYTDGETILYADLDLKDTVRGKFDLDVAGHYSRHEVFRLDVLTRPDDNGRLSPGHSQV